MEKKSNALAECLNQLLVESGGKPISLRKVIKILARRGQAALLVILVLPFCQPLQIPGVSTPFGMVLIFIGLRIAFGHRAWIPQFLLNKTISHNSLEKMITFAIKVTDKLRFLTTTRWTYLVSNPLLHIGHGLSIALMALLLALPLPIPFTNLLAAYPILFFGLGLLEDDGVMICVAYSLSCLVLAICALLFHFGLEFFAYIF